MNKSMLHANIFHGDAAIGLPVYIENEFFDFTYAGDLEFIKVLESPGLVLIADKNSAKEYGKQVVWRAIANEWPVMLISLLLSAISGICVWALVSQTFIFVFINSNIIRFFRYVAKPLQTFDNHFCPQDSDMDVRYFR